MAQFNDTASYDGLMLKYLNWQDVPEEALSVVETAFAGRGVVTPRVWYDTGQTADKSRATAHSRQPGRQNLTGTRHDRPLLAGNAGQRT